MSAASVEVLELLSRQRIDVDEAIRLLKAIKKASGRIAGDKIPIPAINETNALMEMVGSACRPEFSFGNIIAR